MPETATPPPGLLACPCCGLIQRAAHLSAGQRARCARCGAVVRDPLRRSRANARTACAALAGLVLYPFAVALPIMTLQRLGHANVASIWTGTRQLLAGGEWAVGLVVLVCSLILPLCKLLALLAITLLSGSLSPRRRALTYRWIEWTGRWGMLDVLLLAVLVAWVKVGNLVDVSPGPAALTFTLMVLCSLLASAWFDPHAVWEDEETLSS